MKFIKPLAAALMLLFASLASAQSEPEVQDGCAPLYAGQHILVGTVCINVNVDDVDLHYLLIDDWVLTEAHAWIGDNLNNMPQTGSGNPKVGLFPHAVTGLTGVADYSFRIPISDLSVTTDTFCGAELLVAAHAVVKSGNTDNAQTVKSKTKTSKGKGFTRHDAQNAKSDKSSKGGADDDDDDDDDNAGATQTESAWAGTERLSRGSWATYFSYTNQCDTGPTDPTDPTDPGPDPIDPNHWLPLVQPGCANVFATGAGAVTFSSLGLTLPGSAGTIVTLPELGASATYDLSDGNIVYGTVSVTTVQGLNTLQLSAFGDLRISSSNVFNGSLDEFSIDPESAAYHHVFKTVPLSTYGHPLVQPIPGAPLVVHAVLCEAGVTPTN